MNQTARNPIAPIKLRGTSGEHTDKWLGRPIGLAAKSGIPHPPLTLEDVELHPENYVVTPNFTVDESSASEFSVEDAKRYQSSLSQFGFETGLA